MFVFSMIAAAAAATQPLEPVAEADMRCVAALLYAVGSASEKKDTKSTSLLIAAVAYFNGRLDARLPGVNYAGHINRLANSSEFESKLSAEIGRCTMEAGTAMKSLGQAAQAVGP